MVVKLESVVITLGFAEMGLVTNQSLWLHLVNICGLIWESIKKNFNTLS